MKFLVLSCLLASAFAAPSGTHIATPILLTAAPTVDPGDLEAAAINAKVYSEDQARSLDDQARHLADQAREFSDQAREFSQEAVEITKAKTEELTDQVKEKSEEAFWSVEDKKWQALDAVKTAEAKLDGALASNADNIARSAFGVVVPFAPGIAAPAPVPIFPAPVAPIAPAPIFPAPVAPIAPIASPIFTSLSYSQLIKEEMKTDEKKEEKKEEPIIKTAEGEKKDEKLEGDKKPAEFPIEKKPLAVSPFFVAPFAPGFKLGQPILPPLVPFPYALPATLVNQW